MPGPSRAQRAKTARRRAEAIELRIAGLTWAVIAEKLDYADAAAACKDVTRALEASRKAVEAVGEDLRALEVQRLDALLARAWEVLDREHVTVSGGKIVVDTSRPGEFIRDDDGEIIGGPPLRDDGPTLAAIDRILRIAERRARLLGLDAPTKVEQGGQVKYIIEGVDLEALR